MKFVRNDKHRKKFSSSFIFTKNKNNIEKIFENSKKYIIDKLNIESIFKQFYFIEKLYTHLRDKNIIGDLIFDFSQKIPYKVIEMHILDENNEIIENVPNLKQGKIEKIDHSQSVSVLNLIN